MTVTKAMQISNRIDAAAKRLIEEINKAEQKDGVEGVVSIRADMAKDILDWIMDYKTVLVDADVDLDKSLGKGFGRTFLKSSKENRE